MSKDVSSTNKLDVEIAKIKTDNDMAENKALRFFCQKALSLVGIGCSLTIIGVTTYQNIKTHNLEKKIAAFKKENK